MIHNREFLKVVDDAKNRVREITVEEVRRLQEQKVPFQFVDVREDSEWQAGRAAGSIHLGKGIIERDVETEIPDKNAKVVLYCGGGFRSALAGDMLQKMGYRDVLSMAGGIKAWMMAGYPMSS
jgi:rhodanese-related sulfurtransferase